MGNFTNVNFASCTPKLNKVSKRLVMMLMFMVGFASVGFAQLTGVKTIPGDYSKISLAIADLNTQGVGAGGVTFNIAAGYSDTLTARLDITATGTVANPIVFQKSGSGANPVLTSYAGANTPTSTTMDGMIALVGSDYVTFNGIDLREAGTNSTATTQMEYGYGLFKASGTDGANNNTIQNCTITLNRNNFASATGITMWGSTGIIIVPCTPTAMQTITTVTALSGASSNNRIYSNTLQNMNFGIAMHGFAGYNASNTPVTQNCDVNNDIGGSSVSTGNNIINFGGGTSATVGCGAIMFRDQWNYNISYNTVNNNNGSGVNHPNTNRGIFASSTGGTNVSGTISYNNITITDGSSTTAINWAIDYESSQSGSVNNTVNITNNTITHTGTVAQTVAFTSIWLNTAVTTLNVTNNTITQTYLGTSTSNVAAIGSFLAGNGTLNINNNTISSTYGGATGTHANIWVNTAVTTALNINNNTLNVTLQSALTSKIIREIYVVTATSTEAISISNNNFNTVSYLGTTATGEFSFIYGAGTALSYNINGNQFNSGVSGFSIKTSGSTYFCYNSQSTPTVNFKDNKLNGTGLTRTGVSGTMYLYYNFGGPSGGVGTISGNKFSNITLSGTSAFDGIEYRTSTTQQILIFNDTVTNITGGSGITYGIYNGYGAANSAINNNLVQNLTSSGTLYGIYIGTTTATTSMNVYSNIVTGLNTSGALVSGIYQNLGTTMTYYGNRIGNIQTTSATGVAYGIGVGGGTTAYFYNNLIGDIRATTSSNANAVSGLFLNSATAFGVYNNTIHINASSTAATFGSSAVYFLSTATSLDLRNNILSNYSVPGTNSSNLAANGISAVLRRSTGTASTVPSNYSTTSNKNLFYTDISAGNNNHLFYVEGTGTYTNAYNSFSSYKTFMNNRDQSSFSEAVLPYFMSTTVTSSDFLRPSNGTTTQLESGADAVTSPITFTTDFDGTTRGASWDVGAYQFNGSSPAPVISNLTISPTGNQCTATARTVNVDVTTPSGSITSVTLNYSYNGVAQTPVTMTLVSGNTYTGVIPAATPTTATVTWSVIGQNSISITSITTGTSYQDDINSSLGLLVAATSSTICTGTSTSLSLARSGTFNVGAGATTSSIYPNPFYTNWSNTHNQYLIRASELSAAGIYAGNLNSISVPITSGTTALNDFSVKLGTTSATDVSAYRTVTLTNVYSATTFSPVVGSNVIQFSTPFYWDGTSNLIIEFCHGNSGSTTTITSTATADNTSYVSCIHFNRTTGTSGSVICGDVTTGLTTYTVRPRFGFTNDPVPTSISWSDGVSTVGTTNPISVSPSVATTYTPTIVLNGCSTVITGATINVTAPPSAPTATNSTQCGIGIPTASVVSTTGASNPRYRWYSAPSAGTVLQDFGNGPLSTYYSNNFTSATLTNASLSGVAAITGGACVLQTNTASLAGGFTVNASGYTSNKYQVSFDMNVSGTVGNTADGFSYSFADDALATTSSPTAEHGSGSKLRLGFFTYNAAGGSDGKGIYLMYGVTALSGYTSTTPGVLAYSTDVSWINTTKSYVISIDSLGKLTLTVGGTVIFNAVQLPTAFSTSDKSTWKHVFSSRSGGVSGGFSMDNLSIMAGAGGTPTYLTSISAPTNFYVTEFDATSGCESTPRTLVTANVTFGDTISLALKQGGTTVTTICLGDSVDLTPTQFGSNSNVYTLTYTASSATSGITGSVMGGTSGSFVTAKAIPTAAGTYTYYTNYNDGLCYGQQSVTLVVKPYSNISPISATPSRVCNGDSITLSASSLTAASGTPTVGTGTTVTSGTAVTPWSYTWEGARIQYLLLPSELISAGLGKGTINSIAFNVSSIPTAYTMAGYSIKMMQAGSTSSLTTYYTPTSQTTVYGPVSMTAPNATGWKTINFTTPFTWDGVSSVIVEICHDNDPTGICTNCYGGNVSVLASTTAFSSTYGKYADNTAMCGTNNGTLVNGTTRPNMRFTGFIDSTASIVWTWNPGSLSGNTVKVLGSNPGSTALIQTYTVSALGSNGCTAYANVVDTINPTVQAPIATPSVQCGYGIPTAAVASGNGTVSAVFRWYVDSVGTTLAQVGTGASYTSAISVTDTFYVSEVIGTCIGPRVAVIATVNQPDSINLTSSQSAICLGNSFNLNLTQYGSTNTYTYTYSASPSAGSGISGVGNVTSATITPTATGFYTYYVAGNDASLGCNVFDSIYVPTYAPMSGTASATQITSCTNPTGLINANVSGAATVVNNDFTSSTIPSNMTTAGTSFAITGGRMQLTPAVNSSSGGVLITNTTGLARNDFQIDFDFITTSSGGAAADGLSYSYGDDVVALPTATATTTGVTTLAPENGSGTKLKLAFDAINNTGGCPSVSNGNVAGIYLMYNETTLHQGSTCPGVLYYSNDVSWRATTTAGATTHVTIRIDSIGRISMWLNNILVVNNQQLPASYLTADKSTWKHAFAARTGGLNEGHFIDNLVIGYNNFYEYSIDGGTSWTTNNPIVTPGAGTYNVISRYSSATGCTANLGSVVINPLNLNTTSSTSAVCSVGYVAPIIGVSSSFTGATYTFQSSPKGTNTWSTIQTGSLSTDTITSMSQSMDFRVILSCGGTPLDTTNPVTVDLYNSPLSGTYAVGSTGTFAKLSDAFSLMNCVGITGPVTLLLQESSYPLETYPITINAIPGSNSTNTVTVACSTGVQTAMTGNATSLFNINGADNLVFDGSNSGGTDRSLTLTNNNVAGATVFLVNSNTNGARNLTFKNMNMVSPSAAPTAVNYGISIGGTLGASGADNDLITITNNSFSANTGVFVSGTATTSAGATDSLTINNNTFSYSTSTTIAVYGIRVANAVTSTITNNTFDLQSGVSGTPSAISIETGASNVIVERNLISRVVTTSTSGYGGRGIQVGTGLTNANVTIRNNVIYGVNGSNWSAFGNSSSMGIGIGTLNSALTTTDGNVKVYNNTVYMGGTYSSSTACLTAALYVGSGCTNLDVRNNIFTTALQNLGTGAAKAYTVYSAAAATAFANLDYNNYFCYSNLGTQAYVGFLGSDQASFASFKTATGKDVNSRNNNPRFESTTTLIPNAMELNDSALFLATVTNDYLGTTRSATPDFGAYEFATKVRTVVGDSVIAGAGRTRVSGNGWVHFYDAYNNLVFSMNPNGNNLDSVEWAVRVTSNSTPRWSPFLDTVTRMADTGYVLNRNFYITPKNQPTTPVTVRFYYLASEFSGFVNYMNGRLTSPITNNSIYITKFSGNRRSAVDLDPTNNLLMDSIPDSIEIVKVNATVSNWGSNYAMTFNVNSFSEFSAGFSESGMPIILPIELSAFNARGSRSNAILNWTTASEHNANRFEIERSFDGVNFTKIAQVKAVGESTVSTDYAYTDANVEQLGDLVYYRLREVDNDGNGYYSQVRVVRFNSKVMVTSMYPVPATSTLTLGFAEKANATIRVMDAFGKLISTDVVKSATSAQLNVEHLAAGVYFIEVTSSRGTETLKFVKQ